MTKTAQKKPTNPKAVGAKAKPTAPKPKVPAKPNSQPPPQTQSKLDLVADMLRRVEGATIAQISVATNWQAHSVRGAISGALKKRGLAVASEKTEAGRVYRIAEKA